MRNEFCRAMVELALDPTCIFLTGDLGFKALEPLREALGTRFINAGVAEQNMVSVGAGLARAGLRPWVYSIAPFVYARPFEQIRNDICFHDLPVKLVGNGGGYGYGVMGATHHALEDYGALLSLPNLHTFIPAFGVDVSALVSYLARFEHPAYLRLGLAEEPSGFEIPAYAPWRQLLKGAGPTMVIAGTLAGSLLEPLAGLPETVRPNLWVVTELPLTEIPVQFLADIGRSRCLLVAEEHVTQGSAGQALAHRLLELGCTPRRFIHRTALGYPSGRYGSQKFHRRECGLDPQSIIAQLESLHDA